ncbi:MAG: hypothetical protein ACLGH4_01620 [Actinomycetes bacterium]
MTLLLDLRAWSARRWIAAAVAAVLLGLFVALPTDLVANPVFSRTIPPTWWAWPSLVVSAMLGGLLVATYVAPVLDDTAPARRSGYAGGLLTFFAVGCPVCNKLVLLALGSAGALTWFEPVQPLLQVAAVGLLTWALLVRLRGERACRLTPDPERAVDA